jgi:hypothetical protein
MNRFTFLLCTLAGGLLLGCGSEAPAPAAPEPAPSADTPAPAAPAETAPATDSADADGVVYSCPMHPEVTSETKDRCPKCNMFLVAASAEGEKAEGERAEGETKDATHDEHSHEHAPGEGH